ncbi:DNA-binding response regulator [Actinoplanes sp. CA-051413]|uniref:DNA-binding response regulator n=1 Tax=Actinoplanes sp. CA-051413 TaxID=3239899 RepID=UPI003D97636E
MQVRIAVADPLPVFRYGLMEILRAAGFESETPEDLLAWAGDRQAKVIVLTLRSEEDWHLLGSLHRATADLMLVALLENMSVVDSVRALRAGAVCVLPRDASPAQLREGFQAVVRGESRVPVDALRALVASPPTLPPANEPTPTERDWLRRLAGGATVGRLATDAGYSERMMFRLLRDLYTRIGAQNRTDALIRAQHKGWL